MMRGLLKKRGFVPVTFVTDKLPSYGAALKDLGLTKHHDSGGRKNNRAENSQLTVRQRERRMQRFKSARSAQRFLSTHAAVYNTFKGIPIVGLQSLILVEGQGHIPCASDSNSAPIRRACDKLDQRTGPAPRLPRLRATC